IIYLFLIAFTSAAQERNYLLYTDESITRLKNRIKTDREVKHIWDRQYEEANSLLQRDRLRDRDCELLGLAYRMTGKEDFAAAIKRILLDYTSKETWEGSDLLSREPPWQAGLKTSHTSFSIAMGFDCIYDFLSPKERRQIAQEVVRLGITPSREDWLLPGTNFHTFDTMGHNWWSACVYMAGISALAVRNEIPEAASWAKEIAATATEWVGYSGSVLQNKPPTFDRDGGFYESINYASYGISQYLLFRYALGVVWLDEPQVDLPILDEIVDFFINTTYYVKNGSELSTNFGDSPVTKTASTSVSLLWNLGYQQDRYAWYLNQIYRGANNELHQLDDPVDLTLYPELPPLPNDFLPNLPEAHLYGDMGWATLRDSWADNATMLAVKSGFTWNHTHADAGSYILFHQGKNLIIDSGNSSYSNPLYTEYYCQSEAHNVVLFNEKGQNRRDPYYGVVNPGSLHNLIQGSDFKYIMANATGPYSQLLARNYRHFMWVGDVILVIDDLLAHQPGQFEWLLHYNGESTRNGLDISVKEDGAEVLVRPLYPETFPTGGLPHDFPEQMRLTEKLGYKDHEPDIRQPYWSVSHVEETARTKFISAIILKTEENGDDPPLIERFNGDDFLGVSITQQGKTTEVYLNLKADGRLKHRNSGINMNGWETDAYLIALTFDQNSDKAQPGNIDDLFVGHGSYLRRNGKVLTHALSKYTALIEHFDSDPRVTFQGQGRTVFRVRSAQPLANIMLDEKKVLGVYNEKLQMVEVVVGTP
ncbi:MAG: heparinase II/III family protein, partial [Bacteroidota bacterium]